MSSLAVPTIVGALLVGCVLRPAEDCVGTACETGDSVAPPQPTTPLPAPTTQQPYAPQIVDVKLSTDVITLGETVVFDVTVDDVDGLSTIVGGNLRDETGTIVLKPFDQRGDGIYQASLSWAEINSALGIEFEASEQILPLQIVFFDTTAFEGRQTVELTLTCGGGSMWACQGRCIDAATDPLHCGGCNHECTIETGKKKDPKKLGSCFAGTCDSGWSECVDLEKTPHETCDDVCGADGESCTNACEGDFAFNVVRRWGLPACVSARSDLFDQDECSSKTAFTSSGIWRSVQCCCTDGAVF